MGKLSVVTIALLLLFLLSDAPQKPSDHHHRACRLMLRSNFTFPAHPDPHRHHEPTPFDPLVADIERRREDKQWEKEYFKHAHPEVVSQDHHHDPAPAHESQPEWEDFMNAEDYVNDEDKFNVTDRLLTLFPKIDVDPTDGFVTEHELTDWNLKQSEKEVMHRTQREMDIHDKNHDGFVSFPEYEPLSWVLNSGQSLALCLSFSFLLLYTVMMSLKS